MDAEEKAFYKRYFKPLIGAIITEVTIADDGCPELTCTSAVGVVFKAWVQRDPEGNGPGHLQLSSNVEVR